MTTSLVALEDPPSSAREVLDKKLGLVEQQLVLLGQMKRATETALRQIEAKLATSTGGEDDIIDALNQGRLRDLTL